MSAGPEQALAEAVRAALIIAPGVMTVLGDPPRVYEEAPTEPIYPYAALGEASAAPRDSASAQAVEHALTVHVYTRYGGRPEALDAIAAIRAALHDQPLTIPGRKLVYLFAVFADVFRLNERTTHGVVRLKALTEPL